MTDNNQQQPEDENLFDGNEPNDIVPTERKPLDAETKRTLREAHGTTGLIWTFRTANDHDGDALSAGWHYEGSGTLVTAHIDDDDRDDQQ